MTLIQDLRFGFRMLITNPGFTAVSVLTLALGIGASTAIFSVVNAVLLRPFGYAEPKRLIEIHGLDKDGQETGVSVPDFEAFQERAHSFERMGMSGLQTFTLSGLRQPENVYGELVSRECFATLGANPLMGRTFLTGDFQSGAPQVAILSHKLWQTSFEADPHIIGRRILVNGEDYTVIGVMAPDFHYSHPVFQIWAPWRFTPAETSDRTAHGYEVIARLRPAVSREAAQDELQAFSQSLAREFPATNTNWRATTSAMNERFLGDLRPSFLMLLGAVGFVLLIACMNVSNLLMARGVGRTKELAVRAALGARRLRLVRQLLTESLLVASLGGALGLLFAHWCLAGLLSTLPVQAIPIVPRLEQANLDGRVLAISTLACFVTGIIFGILPALRLSRPDIDRSLREGGRSNTGGPWMKRFLSAVIVLETALSVILLVAAGLMIRSFTHMVHVQPGFHADHVLTAQIPSPWVTVTDLTDPAPTARKMQLFQEIIRQVQAIPGVSAAGIVNVLPLGPLQVETRIYIESRPAPGADGGLKVQYRAISPDYFRVMGIQVMRGRAFTEDDRKDKPAVAVVNESMARHFWPREDPVGKRITLENPHVGPWMTVVGVVRDVRYDRLTSAPDPELYTNYQQKLMESQATTVVLRTVGSPLSLVSPVRAAIHLVDPNQPVAVVKTMEQVVMDSVARPRLYTMLLVIFATVAAGMAAAGIFAVVSWVVNQGTHDMGIRMALGATSGQVLQAVMRRSLLEALCGALLGLAGSAALSRFVESQLYGITTTDPLTLAAVTLLLTGSALFAAYIPARRASKVDPIVALRHG